MLSATELKKLEKLARLKLDEKSRDKLRIQLARIIDFVRLLQDIDTTPVREGEKTAPRSSSGREDRAEKSLPRDEILDVARCEKGMFRIPPVIDV